MDYIVTERATTSTRKEDWFLDDFTDKEGDSEDEGVGYHLTSCM
jgi:hypothetical protein